MATKDKDLDDLSMMEMQQMQIEQNLQNMFEIELNSVDSYQENQVYPHIVY